MQMASKGTYEWLQTGLMPRRFRRRHWLECIISLSHLAWAKVAGKVNVKCPIVICVCRMRRRKEGDWQQLLSNYFIITTAALLRNGIKYIYIYNICIFIKFSIIESVLQKQLCYFSILQLTYSKSIHNNIHNILLQKQ